MKSRLPYFARRISAYEVTDQSSRLATGAVTVAAAFISSTCAGSVDFSADAPVAIELRLVEAATSLGRKRAFAGTVVPMSNPATASMTVGGRAR